MGKKVSWYWVFAAIIAGWVFGNSPPDKTPVQNLQQTKSQDVVTQRKQARLPVQKKATPSQKTRRTLRNAILAPTAQEPVTKLSSITMYVDANRLNVRNAPDKSAKQVWTLKRDEKVNVANKNGDWLFVKGSRYEGWVFGT